MQLRSYQVDAVARARAELRAGAMRLLMVSPTGSGKTVLAAEIIRSAVAKGSRVLFLAHRRELISQACGKLSALGINHGVIQAAERMRLSYQVQVASVQTLARRAALTLDPQLIFVDEAHHAAAESYRKLMSRWPRARMIGLTATPWRQDGAGLSELFDAEIIVTSPRDLWEQGFLAHLKCITYRPVELKGVEVSRGDYAAGQLGKAASARELVGDVVGQYLEHCRGRRAVAFCCTIDHAEEVAQAFRSAGVPAERVDGGMPAAERDGVLARMRSGQTHVVTNCNVLTEGFDAPELEVCLLLRPTLSEALYLQMIGRVLRPSPGKPEARVHDHARMLVAHGHPYSDRDWSARRGAKKTRRQIEEAPQVDGNEISLPQRLPEQRDGIGVEVGVDGAREVAPRAEAKPFFRRLDASGKRDFFTRMVAKHGAPRARWIYRWCSGDTEWPSKE